MPDAPLSGGERWRHVNDVWEYRPGGILIRGEVRKQHFGRTVLWRAWTSGLSWHPTLRAAKRFCEFVWRVDPAGEARNGE